MVSTSAHDLASDHKRAGASRSSHAARRSLPLWTAILAAMIVVGSAAPAYSSGGVVGNPQPELAQFGVGAGGGGLGSGAALGTTGIVLASVSNSGTTIRVCEMRYGDRACRATAALGAFSGDSFYGTPEVLVTGPVVTIVAEDCCNIGTNTVVEFQSTNGGRSFSALDQVGTLPSIGAGTVAGGMLVVATTSQTDTDVQAYPESPSSVQTGFATAKAGTDGATALSTYKGGVLVASDDTTSTEVQFAASGSDFNQTSSYANVASFPNETVTAASGNALLTDPGGSLTGGERLRFFNGVSFGSPHRVPDSRAGDDGYFAMQEVGSTVHVFFIGRRAGDDVFSETTSDGVHWSALQQYGSSIGSDELAPVLGPLGSGLVYEADATPLEAQPILNPQGVHVAFVHPRVKAGTSARLHGQATPRIPGLSVLLERLSAGRWYSVSTTREASGGTFSFAVPGTTRTYRAVVHQQPGFYQYGYSNAATVTATT